MKNETTLQVNRAQQPITVLGPGRRVGLWLQGCSIHCRDCVSQDTWAVDAERSISVPALMAWIKQKIFDHDLTGLTISGGEPFDQPDGLLDLLELWHSFADNTNRKTQKELEVLVYSGYPEKHLRQHFPEILALIDALIPEPFVGNMPLGGCWRGSGNQPLLLLSPLAQHKYPLYLKNLGETNSVALQWLQDGDRLWLAGIPRRGDLDQLTQRLQESGFSLKQASWHTQPMVKSCWSS